MKDQAGGTSLDGVAGHATLDRMQNVLFMDSSVHVLRGAQVIDAEKVMALLSENEEVVTHLELRGNASVEGGDGPLQSMKANAIDLDYSDDGTCSATGHSQRVGKLPDRRRRARVLPPHEW